MSLVGNLEDLSLGDILQIISLSQKSGVLVLQSEHGEGRVVLEKGLVRAASVKGHPEGLRELLITGGFIDPEGFAASIARAEDRGVALEEMLGRDIGLDANRLDALVREAVESAVLAMFAWESGDFSFDVRSEYLPEDPKLILPVGINAQYLAMEGMRLRDEQAHRSADVTAARNQRTDATPHDADDVFGEAILELDESTIVEMPPTDVVADASQRAPEPLALDAGRETALEVEDVQQDLEQAAANLIAGSAVERVEAEASGKAPEADGIAVDLSRTPIVAIEPEVAVLEWLKTVIEVAGSRVHVFQQAEQGLARIRQYLVRGERPVVLISPRTKIDPLSGIRGLGDFVKRLKGQAPRLPICWLCEESEEAPSGATPVDGCLRRPAALALADAARSGAAGRDLVDALGRAVTAADRG